MTLEPANQSQSDRELRRMQSNAKDILAATIRRCGVGMGYALFLSFFLSLLQLTVPLYTMQVYDRVMTSRSTDTLVMLGIVAVGGLLLYADTGVHPDPRLPDHGRRAVAPAQRRGAARRRQRDRARHLENPGAQALRDLNDLRPFVTGSAITVPLEAMWVPLFLIVLFLLHTVYGGWRWAPA